MGPSMWQKNPTSFLRFTLLAAGVICSLLLGSSLLLAQADRVPSVNAGTTDLQGRPTDATAAASGQAEGSAATGNISGTVLDATGVPVSGAKVRLTRLTTTPVLESSTAQDGHFSFANVSPGPFELSIALAGFKTKTVSGSLPAQQDYLEPAIKLELAPVVTDVSVRLTTEQIAEEQIKVQEQQKLLAVIPNYYASYVANAAPMNPKQKFELAWKLAIDPTSFVIAGIIAAGQQANNSMPGYGQGAAGYANRFGAAYGDFFIGNCISNAILPSILKQDPRYYYKGTGTIKSRIRYALAMSVITKGDNGRWQPNYSGILGSLAAGGISNLYYPEGSRHGFETTLNNTLIGIGTSAGVNLLQEFVFPKVTPKRPPPKSDHSTT
jgi:Carboxypeptidase regulatory-like domain